jgi:hypothetical protein
MARKVFFSFHYDDVTRANVVRNSDVVARRYQTGVRFYDKSLWEEAKKQGDLAIKRMINGALNGSSVTCVLIGRQTWFRPWVRYELFKSFERGNGIFGVQIHNVGMERGNTLLSAALVNPHRAGATLLTGGTGLQTEPSPGPNPLDYLGFTVDYNRRWLMLYDHLNGDWRVNPQVQGMSLNEVQYQLGGVNRGNFAQLFPVYSWKSGNGYQNFSTWVEVAAQHAGR